MRSVRLIYNKLGRMKFVSHLDMNRLMSRIITKSKIPVWYSEGFNQRIYINYAVPLSLGYEGEYEVMDIKIEDDNFSNEEVINALNSVVPPDISFVDVFEPILKMKDIIYSEFLISFDTDDKTFFDKLKSFLNKESIICKKTTKRGNIKEFDIIPKIMKKEIEGNNLDIILTAGNEDNLNPSLVISKFFEEENVESVYYQVLRKMIFDKDMNNFR